MARPTYDRKAGQLGIHLDFSDAEPTNPKEYGSHVLFEHELLEKLCREFCKVPFDIVKGAFETRGLMDGVILEKMHAGIILAVGFNDTAAVDGCWKAHEAGQLTPVFKQVYITPALLQRVAARNVKLRVRVYKDEVDKCKAEIQSGRVKIVELEDQENDLDMLRKVRDFQKNMADKTLTFKDDVSRFDGHLSEFLMIFKHNLPDSVTRIANMDMYDKHVDRIRRKEGVNVKRLEEYVKLRQTMTSFLTDLEVNICHRLAQVHASSESTNQQQLHQKMKTSCTEMKRKLSRDYNFGELKHSEWGSKLLQGEQKVFWGLISVIAYGSDTVMDIDQSLDEYLAGFDVSL